MLEGIIAGVISAYVVSVFAIAYWFAWLTPHRRRRAQFFGVGRTQRRLRILCSLLQVQPGGAHGNEALRAGFTGPGIIRSEYLGAQVLKSSIETVGRKAGPAVAVDRLRRLTVDIDASPARLGDPIQYDEGALILLGSSIYNRFTKKYFDDNDRSFFAWVRAKNGERTFVPKRRLDKNLPYRRAPKAAEDPTKLCTNQLAVIERHWDQEHRRWVFIVAGVGALATTGAAKYLAEHWQLLERRTRRRLLQPEFALLLLFRNCLPDVDLEDNVGDIPAPTVLRIVDRTMYLEPTDGVLT